ncbi:YdaU family protein [Kiloniella antarctica]|uniref:YdaU family protein n=1 Tax=Kiloniella antarctica TaxID=1550907 RepID=A0ABW5BMT3_9PROT
MSNRAFMPMFWGDYLRDTMQLSTEEHGAYLLLISEYWVKGEPLPDDDAILSKIVRKTKTKWKKIRPKVESFFEQKDGKLHHSRIDEEISKSLEMYEKRSTAGRKGGQAKPKQNGSKMEAGLKQPQPQPQSNKLDKKDNKKDPEKSKPKTYRLPEDWKLCTDCIKYAREKGMTDDEIRTTAEEFKLYWLDQSTKRPGWIGTWKRWVIKKCENRSASFGSKSSGQRPGGNDVLAAYSRVLNRAEAKDALSEERRDSGRDRESDNPWETYDGAANGSIGHPEIIDHTP